MRVGEMAFPEAFAPPGPRVLVVDDDRSVLKAVSEVLALVGCDVIAIEHGAEALCAVAELGFDVAVLDMKMPQVSGMDLLKEIKRLRPEVEVVMMTGFATAEMTAATVQAGAFALLTKPFESIDDIVLTVQKAFKRRAQSQGARP